MSQRNYIHKKVISNDSVSMKDWDWEENNKMEFFPNEITQGCSSKKVFWRCSKCGKSYPMSPYNKITLKYQCSHCGYNKKISSDYNLTTEYPNLVKEWDYNKNYPICPEKVAPKSIKKYYWLCPNGHSYEASPNNRNRIGKSRCKICYIEENNLAAKNPLLAKEWHPTKNAKTPSDVTYSKNEKAWWLCSICNHEWEALIGNRHKGRGCPECSKGTQTSFPEQVIVYYLKEAFPDTISRYKFQNYEIDAYIPSLKVGVEYDGEYFHKSLHSHKKDKKKNDFLFSHGIHLIRIREEKCYPLSDDLAEVYLMRRTPDYLNLPPILDKILGKLANKAGVELNIRIEIEQIKNEIKSKIHSVCFEDSLASFIQEKEKQGNLLKADWDYEANYPLIPEMITPGVALKVWWLCRENKDHKWKAPIYSISAGGGCPECTGRYKTTEKFIKQARLIHGDRYNYSNVTYIKSESYIQIICKIHGIFPQTPTNHLQGQGCPYCVGQGGFHPLETLAVKKPDLAMEWDYEGNYPLTPNDVVVSDSKKQYLWKCTNGKPHSYKATIPKRIHGTKCAVCVGNKQVSWDTSLEYLRPDLLSEWHESNILKPSDVKLKSERKVIWKCANPDHSPYEMPICERVKASYGCQICSGRKRTHDSFSKQIAELFPYIKLTSRYVRSDKKIDCWCLKCGHKWSPIANNLLISKGCKKCRELASSKDFQIQI